MDILLLSTYELGHQPLGLARPAGELVRAGHRVTCQDLAVEPLDEAAAARAGLIAISIPMHTATRLAVGLVDRLRGLNPRAHVCLYGLYASLNAPGLLGRAADSVIGGEYEGPLVELAGRLGSGADPRTEPVEGVQTAGGGAVFLGRRPFALPARSLLPPLERYARLDDGVRRRLAGYVEASRGCAHRCKHCPITPVYAGRLRIVEPEVVLEDVRQLVALGAEHITFGDPDFFNAIKHSRRILERLHAEQPNLTYDVTIKIEHLIEHRSHLPLLRETGCAFVVSAVESLEEAVLARLAKGHRAADVELALGLTRAQGLVLRPTFVPFTPWTSAEGYLGLLDFVEREGLIDHVAPIQLAIRLLVPRGSTLLEGDALGPYLQGYDESTFTHLWRHPDPRLDRLQLEIQQIVERAARAEEEADRTFGQIKRAARAALADDDSDGPAAAPRPATASRVPRLTEAWFC